MAVSYMIDRVYQKVLALANKEQRGYITPLEFNLFADHAQMDIFEQYFYDLEQRYRGTGNEFDYADIANNIEEKISMFEIANQNVSFVNVDDGIIDISNSIKNLYRLGTVKIQHLDSSGNALSNYYPVEQMQIKDFEKYNLSPLALFGSKLKSSVYTKYSTAGEPVRIQIHPSPGPLCNVKVSYIRKPGTNFSGVVEKPNWTYVLAGYGSKNALFQPSNSDFKDFELHASEENNLVIKILQLAGVSIKDFNLAQIAGQEEASVSQQQKQ